MEYLIPVMLGLHRAVKPLFVYHGTLYLNSNFGPPKKGMAIYEVL